MPSRVTPFGASVSGDQEMPTSITAPSVTNDVPFIVEIQEQENANERLLKEIDEVYSPLLNG